MNMENTLKIWFKSLKNKVCLSFFMFLISFIFLDENVWILIKFSLKFVHRGPFNNIPALV